MRNESINDLLIRENVRPEQVLILRHRPTEPRLNKVLPWLAAEKHETFNAYQQTQSERVEAIMSRAKFVASFIGHEPGKALFVGLYTMNGRPIISREAILEDS